MNCWRPAKCFTNGAQQEKGNGLSDKMRTGAKEALAVELRPAPLKSRHVSANGSAYALRAVSFPALPVRWRARRSYARVAAAIHGFADGASRPPDVLCSRGPKAGPIWMFVACNHPSQDNDDLLPPVPLPMDGNALNP